MLVIFFNVLLGNDAMMQLSWTLCVQLDEGKPHTISGEKYISGSVEFSSVQMSAVHTAKVICNEALETETLYLYYIWQTDRKSCTRTYLLTY